MLKGGVQLLGTPLVCAAQGGELDVCKLLLNAGSVETGSIILDLCFGCGAFRHDNKPGLSSKRPEAKSS